MRLHAATIVSLVLLSAVTACPKPASKPTGPVGAPVDKQVVVPPGKFVEANLHLEAGAIVDATYDATDLVQWNVHSHPGKDPVTHEQGEGTAGTIRFTAPKTGAYSILWQNDNSSAIKLSVTLKGGRLESWVP
jgi:hypothetical protein